MIKISPVKNIITTTLAKHNKNFVKNPFVNTNSIAPLAIGATGLIISTFLQDYKKTADEENYFQLKVDKTTGKPYKADIFQNAAAMNLYLGNDVLVTAPTGTGKTAIAEYVITKNLNEGGRTFYTTPLKALSNEKFLNFSKTYGEENVGLITGDTKINTDAPIIIMTTEVYRNMAANDVFGQHEEGRKGIPQGLKTVIFDELQYLGDIDRGGIWEQSLMFTPKDVQILSLSATIGNNKEINNWIASLKGNKATSVTPKEGYVPKQTDVKHTVLVNVPSANRHVPLEYSTEHAPAEINVPRGLNRTGKIKAKREGARIAQSMQAKPCEDFYKSLTRKLNAEGKLPAIYFVFSKRDSRHLLKLLSNEAEILTNDREQKEILSIIERYKEEGVYLGERLNVDALRKGYAVHNAGLLPSQKTLVEELFQKKLVKVVIATETLSAGINMPAKTTVISSPRKPASTSDGGNDHKRNLTPNEFHQMAGRAGRRAIDTEGFCYTITCNPAQTAFYNELIESPSNRLDSNLDIDFSFIANHASGYNGEENVRDIFSKSFYAYDNGKYNQNLIDLLVNNFHIKKDILKNEDFISPNGNLTTKGHLLKYIHGYEQVPIISLIDNKTLAKLTPIQLVGVIGGLANIEYNTKGEFPQKPFSMKTRDDSELEKTVQKVSNKIREYGQATEELYPDRELNYKGTMVDHMYAWALLNSKNEDSRETWKELTEGDLKFSITDEGSLFKEITMTTDLIKQLIEICKEGAKISQTLNDEQYYLGMVQKLQEGLDLITREPISTTM